MDRNKVALVVLLFLVSSSVVISPSYAQTTFGQITGTVVDPSGAVVPGATVTVTNEGTQIAREVSTSASGVFSITNLNVGTYRVRITVTGFSTFERGGLILSANQVINVNCDVAGEVASSQQTKRHYLTCLLQLATLHSDSVFHTTVSTLRDHA